MKNKMSKILTLAILLALSLSNNAMAANNVLKTKSFQWVRGQLWVYGPDSFNHSIETPEVLHAVTQTNQDNSKQEQAAKSSPEELTKALQKASAQKL